MPLQFLYSGGRDSHAAEDYNAEGSTNTMGNIFRTAIPLERIH